MARTSPQPNRRPAIGGNFDLLKRTLTTDGNPVRFRQGKVIAYSSGANTVDVQIAGATDESGNAVVTAGIKLFGNFIPDINQAVWLVTDNTDIFAIGQLAPYGLAGGGGGGGTGNVAYQDDPPASPSIGDVWIESDVDLGPLILSDLGVTATATELNYVDGVTSPIQTQLNNRYTKTESDDNYVSKTEVGTVAKVFSTKLNLTQAVYGTTGYNFYNQTYTTNSKTTSKLLITFGVAYEMNVATDTIQLAVSLNGTDEFTFIDTNNSVVYNEMPFYTFISTNSYAPNTTISNLRVYIKSLTGSVVCPRSAGTLHNFFLTVQEIAA